MQPVFILIEWCFHNKMDVQPSWTHSGCSHKCTGRGRGSSYIKSQGKGKRHTNPKLNHQDSLRTCPGTTRLKHWKWNQILDEEENMLEINGLFMGSLELWTFCTPSPVSVICVLSPKSRAENWWDHTWLHAWKFVLSHQCKYCLPNLYICTN